MSFETNPETHATAECFVWVDYQRSLSLIAYRPMITGSTPCSNKYRGELDRVDHNILTRRSEAIKATVRIRMVVDTTYSVAVPGSVQKVGTAKMRLIGFSLPHCVSRARGQAFSFRV